LIRKDIRDIGDELVELYLKIGIESDQEGIIKRSNDWSE
jgi:hypothetical protein